MSAHLSFLKRWWFWALLLIALIVVWQVRERLAWSEQQQGYLLQNQITTDYWHTQQRLIAEREAAYKTDQYGGATPEETLRLFIEALEQEDYVLASKYFVVEEQSNQAKRFQEASKGTPLETLIQAYRYGDIKLTKFENEFTYEAVVTPKGGDLGFLFTVVLNQFTGKWKIESF